MPPRALLLWVASGAVGLVGFATAPTMLVDRGREALPAPRARMAADVTAPSLPIDSGWTRAPFRLDRLPPTRRFREGADVDTATHVAPRPPWRVTGFVTTDRTLVVLEIGDPSSRDATLAEMGDVVDGYLISSIRGDTVVVQRDELEWIFTLEDAWR